VGAKGVDREELEEKGVEEDEEDDDCASLVLPIAFESFCMRSSRCLIVCSRMFTLCRRCFERSKVWAGPEAKEMLDSAKK